MHTTVRRVTTVVIAGALTTTLGASALALEEAPSPSASPPIEAPILSRDELASVLAAVAMAGSEATVLAETAIRRDLPERALRCGHAGFPRPERCPIGVIEPDTPGTGLLQVVATDDVVASLPDDGTAIEGTLGFRIDGDALELLGILASDVTDPDWMPIGGFEALEGAGPPTVTAEEAGLVLEVWLSDTTVEVGDRLTSLVRVSNTGTERPRWETNICQVGPAPTTIEPTLPDAGKAWTGKAATFKRKLLAEEWRPALLQDIDMVGREDVGCTAWGKVEPFVPGSVSQMVLAWDAIDRPGRPVLPGPATVTSRFETVTQPKRGPDRQHEAVTATAAVEITGEPGTVTPVSDYADAALSDDAFRAWVERQRRPRYWDASAIYWPNSEGEYPKGARYERATEGAVDIGMFVSNGPYGAVTIDSATLEVLGRRLPR